jgi:hypothetical protein
MEPRASNAKERTLDSMTTTTKGRFADAVANYVHEQMFEPHRGVIQVADPRGGRPLFVLFGNDSYLDDDRTKQYADHLFAKYRRNGYGVEFGTGGEGYTWAIVLSNFGYGDRQWLDALEQDLYRAYRRARGVHADDGMVQAMGSIHKRETIERTNGQPITVPGWESLN